jgi:hypothetical protein
VPRWWIAHLALVRRSDVGLPTSNAGFELAGRALLLSRRAAAAARRDHADVPQLLVLASEVSSLVLRRQCRGGLIARVLAVVLRIVAKSRRYVEAGHGGLLEVEFVVLA